MLNKTFNLQSLFKFLLILFSLLLSSSFAFNNGSSQICTSIKYLKIQNVGWPGYAFRCDLKSILNSEYITFAINSLEPQRYSIKMFTLENQQKYLNSSWYNCLNNDCEKVYKSNEWPPAIFVPYHNDNLPNGTYYVYVENKNYLYPNNLIVNYMFNPTELLFNTYFSIETIWTLYYTNCNQSYFSEQLYYKQKIGNWLIFDYKEQKLLHSIYMNLRYFDKYNYISAGDLYIDNYKNNWKFEFGYNLQDYFVKNLTIVNNQNSCKFEFVYKS